LIADGQPPFAVRGGDVGDVGYVGRGAIFALSDESHDIGEVPFLTFIL
jgi:hypothetical protein